MSENKTFLDSLPEILQFLILFGLVALFSTVFGFVGMVLIKPLYGINGADTFLAAIQANPDSIKGDMKAINALKLIQLFSSIGLLIPTIFLC